MALVLGACGAPEGVGPLAADREPVSDSYHGVEVTEDYRWLENGNDPRVVEWAEAQNQYARAWLSELPQYDELRTRVEEIIRSHSVSHYGVAARDDRLFAIRRDPTRDQPALAVMDSADDVGTAVVLVDPMVVDPSGGTTIDWYRPSPDGSIVAVSLSEGGSESGTVHFYAVPGGDEIGEPIPRVNGGTAGGDLVWTNDGSGFYYTRYPREGERPAEDMSFFQQLWFRTWDGTIDRYELGKEFPRVAEIRVAVDPSSERALVTMQYGDSGRFEVWLRDGEWSRLAEYDDKVVQAVWSPDGTLFLVSRLDAPKGKILRLAPGATSLDGAVEIVPEGEDALVTDFYGSSPMVVTDSRVYATYQLGGPSTVRAFDHDGRPVDGPELLPVSSVGQIAALGGDAILFSNTSYLEPRVWLRFDGETKRTAMSNDSPVDLSGAEVVREWATSRDGTQVPVNIVRPRGVELDRSNPTLLSGYGGFGVSREPRFSAMRAVWLERGGVFASANIRGGGEFGEAWHRDGMLTNKQNVFDDFAACMQHLIDQGYTSPEKLAIIGGSNGGLLMGAMITQHPELFRATVSYVGIYDMLRVELSSNGAFNIPEYGTVEDPDQFQALYAYSPYHNVRDGAAYPSVLFMTGANDPRVDPMQSRKMTARLQAANASKNPIVLRLSGETGHGLGTPLSEVIEENAAVYAFLLHELGVTTGE